MKSAPKSLLVAAAILSLVLLGGCSTIKLAGRVAVKGSEPHTYLVLVADGLAHGTSPTTSS